MTIFFPDVSGYQNGLVFNSDNVAIIAKATEGVYYRDAAFAGFQRQAASAGAVFSGYHFVKQEGSAAAQAQYYHDFAGNTPVMLDVESEGSSKPGMIEIMSFINTTKNLGGRPWGVYLPHWYWQEIGSPDLTPIRDAGAVLVSSSYIAYSDTGPGWAGYGGMAPTVWQYTDAFSYKGWSIDFNAYRGSVADFHTLVTGAGSPPPPPAGEPVVSLAHVIGSAKVDPARPTGETSNWNDVIWVEKALNAEGLLASQYVDGSYGSMTVAAYAAWQRKLGYAGSAADGIPGMASLSKLGAAHGFLAVA